MKEKLFYGTIIIVLLWVVVSTLEIQMHNLDRGYVYSKANVWVLISAHTTDMKVVDCQGYYTDDYEVTVEDINGNQWTYIDSTPKVNGEIIRITISGTEIIDAR